MSEDLDDQLLALVGGGKKEDKGKSKSSKKKSSKKRRHKKSSSSDEEGEIAEESDEDLFQDEPPQKPLKKRKMEEEESDDEKFDDGYQDDLMGDEEDRRHLSKLSEVERENILAERYTKRQEGRQRFELKKKLQREKEMKDGKRRTPSRSKVERGNKASALSDLKKKRAKANQPVGGDSEEEEIKDEIEEDEDSEDDFVIKEDKERMKKDEGTVEEPMAEEEREEPAVPLTLTQLQEICVKRDYLEKKLDEPYFNKLLENCFVRIGIGLHNGKSVYRVAQIVEVTEGSKKYRLGKRKTNKMFKLRHGANEKNFTFECASNHRVQESEYQKWRSEMEKNNLHITTNKEVDTKKKEIKDSKNYAYTDEEIKKMVEAKKELHGGKPLNIAAERVRLLALRDALKDSDEKDEVERINKEIENLDQMVKEGKTVVDKATRAQMINERNQQANQSRSDINEVRGAWLSANPDLDPFSRRQTKPSSVISWLVKPKEEGQDNEDEKKEDNAGADTNGHNKNDEKKEKKKETNKGQAKKSTKTEEDIDPETLLKQAHDFDISLDEPPEIEKKENQTKIHQEEKRLDNKSDKPKQKKPTLSVADYKRRMGLL